MALFICNIKTIHYNELTTIFTHSLEINAFGCLKAIIHIILFFYKSNVVSMYRLM